MAPCRLRNVQFDVAIAAIATMRWTGVAHAITLSAIEDRAVGAVAKAPANGKEEVMERSLKWVEQKDYRRFGCTQCSWSHPNPSLRDDPATMDAAVLNFIRRAFAEHFCDRYSKPKSASRGPTDLTGKVLIVEAPAARSWFDRLTEGARVKKVLASDYRSAPAR